MSCEIVRLSLDQGIHCFYCAVCGAPLIDGENGLSEALCDHVVAVVDWADELHIGPAVSDKLSEELALSFEQESEDVASALAKVMSVTTVFYEFVEPSRGGGHDGSSIRIALEFATSGADAEG